MTQENQPTPPGSKALQRIDDLLDKVFFGDDDEPTFDYAAARAQRNREKTISPEDNKYFYARHVYTSKVIELAYRVSPQQEGAQNEADLIKEWEEANSNFEARTGDPVIDQAFALADHIAREGKAPEWAQVRQDYSGSIEWQVYDDTNPNSHLADLPA